MVDMEKAEDEEEKNLYQQWISAFTSVPLNLPFTTMGKGVNARTILKDHVRELFRKERDNMKNKPKETAAPNSGSTVVDMLLLMQQESCDKGGEDGIILEDDELMDNLLLFLVAGHETGFYFFL